MVEAALTRFRGVLAFFAQVEYFQPLGLQAGSCSSSRAAALPFAPTPGGAARLGGGAKEEQLHARG